MARLLREAAAPLLRVTATSHNATVPPGTFPGSRACRKAGRLARDPGPGIFQLLEQSVGKNKAEALKLQLQNFYGVKVEAFGVRLAQNNVDSVLGTADLLIDCFDNQESRNLLSTFARRSNKPLVHAAIAGDGRFGIVRWDERFVADAEDTAGQATCEGGEHLPLIGLVAATLVRTIQDFLQDRAQRDSMISLNGVQETPSS